MLRRSPGIGAGAEVPIHVALVHGPDLGAIHGVGSGGSITKAENHLRKANRRSNKPRNLSNRDKTSFRAGAYKLFLDELS
jgi:hypothetical protein